MFVMASQDMPLIIKQIFIFFTQVCLLLKVVQSLSCLRWCFIFLEIKKLALILRLYLSVSLFSFQVHRTINGWWSFHSCRSIYTMAKKVEKKNGCFIFSIRFTLSCCISYPLWFSYNQSSSDIDFQRLTNRVGFLFASW